MAEENSYSRKVLIERLESRKEWDFIVIGGGATGLGVALDAASRGFSTLLLEQHDFAKGTSSRSTKLIHGGVRYLAQGDLKLVYSALRERAILLRNANHLVKMQSFIIPCYTMLDVIKYAVGLRLYDILAGRFNFKRSHFLSKIKTLTQLGNISAEGLKGGIEYYDGQFDDSRLAVNIAQTAIEHSATLLNYFAVTGLIRKDEKVKGVRAKDLETGRSYDLSAKAVINATGVFVDDILQMDDPAAERMIRPSQGIHIVISNAFLKGTSALMIPKTSDGRVLFAVPWHNHLIAGTTDTPRNNNALEPEALDMEIDFVLSTLKEYMVAAPGKQDVLSVFAGLRPLAASKENTEATKELSRDHKLFTAQSGLITITGGKWTTYRKMAEETIDLAIKTTNQKEVKSKTTEIPIHGAQKGSKGPASVYGSDEQKIRQLINENAQLAEILVEGHPYVAAHAIWAVRYEMARTVEDVLARRIRLLFLDARAAKTAAPKVARLIASELGLNEEKMNNQLNDFYKLADQYILNIK